LLLLSISYFYLGGNNLVTSVASRDMLPRDAALADLPKVSTSTAGVALTIAALGAAVVLPEAVIPVAFGAGILGTSMAVGGSLSVFA
jgi:hypothetical protein